MCLSTNIVKRGGSARYYCRVAVPKDLQAIVGKRELWKSLGTADPRTARERGSVLVTAWLEEFAELRRKRQPSEADLQAAVWRQDRMRRDSS